MPATRCCASQGTRTTGAWRGATTDGRQHGSAGGRGDPGASGRHALAARRSGGARGGRRDDDGDAALAARRARPGSTTSPCRSCSRRCSGRCRSSTPASRRTSSRGTAVIARRDRRPGALVARRWRWRAADARALAGPDEAPDRDPRLVGGRARPPALRGDRHRRGRGLRRRDRPLVGRRRRARPRRSTARSTPRSAGSPREVDPEYRHDVGIWGGEGSDLHVFFHTHALNPETGLEDDLGTIFRVDAAHRRGARPPRRLHLAAAGGLGDQRAAPVPRRPARPALPARSLGPDPDRHPRADDDGGGGLGRADAPPPDPRPLRRRAARAGGWPRCATGTCWRRAGASPSPSCSPSPARSSASPAPSAFRWSPSVAFGGDEEAMSATLFEPPVPEDATPAPLASLDYILADSARARRRAGHLRRHLRLRPRRRAGARLARPGRGRHALRHQRLRRPEPRLPRAAGAGRHRALRRRHCSTG